MWLLIKRLYHIILAVLLVILLTRCCPGSKNLAYPQEYTALDIARYCTTIHCLLSKMDESHKTQYGYKGIINGQDDFLFETIGDSVYFFKIEHHDFYEDLYAKWNYYKMKLQAYKGYSYKKNFTFSGKWFNYYLQFNLNRYGLSVVAYTNPPPSIFGELNPQ